MSSVMPTRQASEEKGRYARLDLLENSQASAITDKASDSSERSNESSVIKQLTTPSSNEDYSFKAVAEYAGKQLVDSVVDSIHIEIDKKAFITPTIKAITSYLRGDLKTFIPNAVSSVIAEYNLKSDYANMLIENLVDSTYYIRAIRSRLDNASSKQINDQKTTNKKATTSTSSIQPKYRVRSSSKPTGRR